MRNFLFLLVLCPVLLFGTETVNCFIPGSIWHVSSCAPFDGYKECMQNQLGEAIEMEGIKCMPLSSSGTRYDTETGGIDATFPEGLEAYLRAEGGLVYGRKNDGKSWRLLYDFNLQEGESGVIDDLHDSNLSLEVVCVERKQLSANSKLTRLVLREKYFLRTNPDGTINRVAADGEEDYWIVGIGSMAGVLGNSQFGRVGGGSNLYSVYCDGLLVWGKPIENTKTDVIYVEVDKSVRYYDMLGRSIVTPAKGQMVVRVSGSRAEKIVM